MNRLTRFLAGLLVLCLGLGTYAWTTQQRPAPPEQFDLSFSGTGLVEAIETPKKGRCIVQVALYDWINLSQGFALSEIPQQNQRYYLRGEGETCQALTVAMASTNNHIGFEAGLSTDSWYFTETPMPALGCGGLEIDWTPPPL